MTPRPNILWIITTQWRAQAFGFAGDVNARTPCIDALARHSVNYSQAVTPHPFGPFARAAMLTGVASPKNGVRDYYDSLPAGAPTVAGAMRGRGFATAYFGAWHLGERERDAPLVGEAQAKMIVPPERRGGFEFWEGFGGGFLLNDPWLHGSSLREPRKFQGYQSNVVADRAADWIKGQVKTARSEHRPWFAVVSFEAPHPPYDASADGHLPVEPGGIALAPNVTRGGETEAKARKELAGYYAHIAATDGAIGRLLDAIDGDAKTEGEDAPVVIFTSVHGDMHGSHGLFRKGWPHEESVRVPLLVRMPGIADANACADAISLVDLKSITLALADGNKVTANHRHALISMPSVVALPHQCDRIWRGVRTPSRKLVLNEDGSPWLFFDLERDPWEQENLATDSSRREEVSALCEQVELRPDGSGSG